MEELPRNFFSKSWRRVLTGNWARLGSIRYFILRDTFENDLIPALPPSGHGEAFCSARYQPEIICVHGVAKILLRYERFQAVHHTNIYTALYTCDRRLPARLRSLEGIGSERDPWITGMRRISPPPPSPLNLEEKIYLSNIFEARGAPFPLEKEVLRE